MVLYLLSFSGTADILHVYIPMSTDTTSNRLYMLCKIYLSLQIISRSTLDYIPLAGLYLLYFCKIFSFES